MKSSDPAYELLIDNYTSKPVIFRAGCYICEDPEYAQMGLPLCRLCSMCKTGHVPADDSKCDDCGFDERELPLQGQVLRKVVKWSDSATNERGHKDVDTNNLIEADVITSLIEGTADPNNCGGVNG